LSQLSNLGRSVQQGDSAGCFEDFLDLGFQNCVIDGVDLGGKKIAAGGAVERAAVMLLDGSWPKTFGKVGTPGPVGRDEASQWGQVRVRGTEHYGQWLTL
jgi:hypothetical protein